MKNYQVTIIFKLYCNQGGGNPELPIYNDALIDSFPYPYALNCQCQATLNTQIWSKEKFDWSKRAVGLKFPSDFSMLSGCAVSINKHEVLFIGGHHTQQFFQSHYHDLSGSNYYPLMMPVNNQVIKYDFKNDKWESITAIPIVKVSEILIDKTTKIFIII